MEKRHNLRMSFKDDNENPEILNRNMEILDMSAEGACVRSERHYDAGKVVLFELDLKDAGEQISFKAEVRWAKPMDNEYLIGLKFLE